MPICESNSAFQTILCGETMVSETKEAIAAAAHLVGHIERIVILC